MTQIRSKQELGMRFNALAFFDPRFVAIRNEEDNTIVLARLRIDIFKTRAGGIGIRPYVVIYDDSAIEDRNGRKIIRFASGDLVSLLSLSKKLNTLVSAILRLTETYGVDATLDLRKAIKRVRSRIKRPRPHITSELLTELDAALRAEGEERYNRIEQVVEKLMSREGFAFLDQGEVLL